MDHFDYAVDVLDASGQIIGQKPRQSVDKERDIFNSVHVVLVTPNREAVLSVIPARTDLPNLYAGLLGTTMATIRHHGETAEEAARRGLKRELSMSKAELIEVRDGMVTLSDGRRTHLTAFKVVAPPPADYRQPNVGELMPIDSERVDVAVVVRAERFAPTLKAIWPSLEATG